MAKYHYYRNPGTSPENEGGIHPRLVGSKKVTVKNLAERITAMSTFTSAETKALLDLVKEIMIDEFVDGNHLYWEDFGTFTVSLKAKPTNNPKDLTPSSIEIGKINFRPTKEVRQRFKRLNLERADRQVKLPSMTPLQRQRNILGYLKKNKTVQSSDCPSFNGCSRNTAIRDLKVLKEKGYIKRLGGRKNAIYVLAEESKKG